MTVLSCNRGCQSGTPILCLLGAACRIITLPPPQPPVSWHSPANWGQSGLLSFGVKAEGCKMPWEPPRVQTGKQNWQSGNKLRTHANVGGVGAQTLGWGKGTPHFCLVEESLCFLNLGQSGRTWCSEMSLSTPAWGGEDLAGVGEHFCSGEMHSSHQQSAKATESLCFKQYNEKEQGSEGEQSLLKAWWESPIWWLRKERAGEDRMPAWHGKQQ